MDVRVDDRRVTSWHRQIRQLQDAGELNGVLCLCGSGEDDVLRQTHGLTTAALAEVQAAATLGFSPALVWVTHQAVGTGVEVGPMHVGAAPLWGLLRTARTEHPELRLRLVDVGAGPGDIDNVARALSYEGEPEIRFRCHLLINRRAYVGMVPCSLQAVLARSANSWLGVSFESTGLPTWFLHHAVAQMRREHEH